MKIPYFDEETVCACCKKNKKRVNQIVCDKCHKNMPRGLIK